MLVLTRRVGETIRIGDNITIRVLGSQGNAVSLGIDAPKEVNILREELLNRKTTLEPEATRYARSTAPWL